jgi:hypothetical protein
MFKLSEYFQLDRRYARSINLERDLDNPKSVAGYVLTDRSLYALKQILVNSPESGQTQAVTLTGVYGTGKSAFAHFLACLCAGEESVKQKALAIAKTTLTATDFQKLHQNLPEKGCFRAIATAQREPLAHTIIRALDYGASRFWKRKAPSLVKDLTDLSSEILGGRIVDSKKVISIIQEVITSAQTDVILIIDELGKNLEYASLHPSESDLYLLQQLAELKPNQENASSSLDLKFYLIGLLHQSFADYGERLASLQRNEWAKIQGRFQDIPFTESPRQMTWLIGKAIARSNAPELRTGGASRLPSLKKYDSLIKNQAKDWCEVLRSQIDDISPELLAAAYPLHPITALVLPILCTRYAQNDRSLFTFLTSSEPYGLQSYLKEFSFDGDRIPLLKLDRVYDYFIESAGMGLANRPQLQKWVEIQNLVSDASKLDAERVKLLKTVGILNLITSTGGLKASRAMVKWALCDQTDNQSQQAEIDNLIDELLNQKGILHHRKQIDELRIWEGSDFDVQNAINTHIEQERSPLAKILTSISKLKPVVAQRHSYITGTTRYFERVYIDADVNWSELRCSHYSFDGMIGYWVSAEPPQSLPSFTSDGKPLIVVMAANLKFLQMAALEYTALQKIQSQTKGLDRVATLEVRHRLIQAKRIFDEDLGKSFEMNQQQNGWGNVCWIEGEKIEISRAIDFNSKLSAVCDRFYDKGLTLWNELINRRELSSQMVRALRTLIQAMLDHSDHPQLGLTGNSPEVSIYTSVLNETKIHRQEDESLGFYAPTYPPIQPVWEAIENFCLESLEKPRTIDQLYAILDAPPYGVKRGVVPILLAAVWLHHMDDVSVYKDGTFIPVLGSEHFELLVKHPQRFATKHFEIVGLRSQVFRELENVLRSPNANHKSNPKKASGNLRNTTMLSVVKPLFQFVKKLPAYTTKTTRISSEAQAVVRTLQTAQEPDVLLFQTLPVACGLTEIAPNQEDDGTTAKKFKGKLVQILQEVQTAYDRLLTDCQSLLHDAFAVRRDEAKLREDLRMRASYLTDNCSERLLKRFVIAAADETVDDRQWLESLLMIIADKPAESWTDADVQSFEPKLTDLARRFMNLEALQKEMAASYKANSGKAHSGAQSFDARRITIARPDGQEVHQLIWLDPKDSDRLEVLVEKILSEESVQGSDRLQQALIAKLAERVLRKS